MLAAIAGELRQIGGADHRSGRVGRARDDQAVERACLGQQLGGRLVMRILPDLDQHRLDIEGRQNVAVSRVAGNREPDPVAGLESGEKPQLKGGRRAGRDDDLGGIDRDSVLRAVIGGDRLPQRRYAERIGISDPLIGQGAPGGLQHRLGRRSAGLADFEMNDIGAGGLALVGGAQHVHRDKGWDEPPPRRAQRHAGAHPSGLKSAW